MLILFVAVAVIAIILTVLLVPVKAVAEKKEDFDFYVKVFFIKIRLKNKGSKKEKKQNKSTGKKKKSLSFATVKKIAALSEDIKALVSFFANKCIVIDELKIYLKFGTGDAAQTGVATGILNTLAYSITGAVHQNVRLKKWSVDIVPEFEKENYEFQFLCIGTTRVLHIINVGIKALKLYKKFKTI